MLSLKTLSLIQFRNYIQKQFEFDARIVGIVGANGTGKTNILDAIYHLAYGKSYFNPLAIQNIKHGEEFLTEALEEEKKTPPIGKPKRGGSKKFYVYVRDKGKVKKVSFGMAGGGLRAKLNNPKARQAFSKRHNCPQKKDRTKASYWSCRLPRYAKLLGFKTTFSGYW